MEDRVKVGEIKKPEGKEKWIYFVDKQGGVFATPPRYMIRRRSAVEEAQDEVEDLF